jgi:hypothetical protein
MDSGCADAVVESAVNAASAHAATTFVNTLSRVFMSQ